MSRWTKKTEQISDSDQSFCLIKMINVMLVSPGSSSMLFLEETIILKGKTQSCFGVWLNLLVNQFFIKH